MNFKNNLQKERLSLKKKTALVGLQLLICLIYSVDFYWHKLAVKPFLTNSSKFFFFFQPTYTFFDMVTKNTNAVFIKNGANLDSIVKVSCVQVLTQLVSFTVVFLDKYVVSFSLKKNAESLLNSTSGLFNALKRTVTGSFSTFWYVVLLVSLLIFLV